MVREIPLSVLFTWPQPNYVDPVTRGPALIIVNAIFVSLCTVSLFVRLYTRVFLKRWFGSDDVFIILAYMSTVGLTINVIIANKHYYWDRHIWDVPLTAFSGVLKVAFSAKLIFVYASTFTRQSLLCFYYRLVADSGIRWFGWALHLTVFLNVAAAITFTCLGIWQCNPTSAYWALVTPAGAYCIDEGKTVLGVGIVNCFIDLVVTILPIPLVRKLQMPIQQRIGVMVLLSLGLAVVVAGVVRTYYIWKGLIASYDETWYTFPLWIAAAVEINLGVICACMPALRPFFKRCIFPVFSDFSSRISSFISRTTTTTTTSTSGNTLRNSSRGHRTPIGRHRNSSYQKFSDGSNSTGRAPSFSNDPNAKHPYIAADTTTTTTAAANNDHDNDEVSFFTRPAFPDRHTAADTTAIRFNTTAPLPPSPSLGTTAGDGHHDATRFNTTAPVPPSPSTDVFTFPAPQQQQQHLPAAPPHSPLRITYRQSFELVSLDRTSFHGGLLASSPPTQGQGEEEEEMLEEGEEEEEDGRQWLGLDPREREGSAAFGCRTRVECLDRSGDDEEMGASGKKGGRRGRGWGRMR